MKDTTKKFINEIAAWDPGYIPTGAYLEALIHRARELQKKSAVYFVLFDGCNVPKNKLQRDVVDYLKTQNRTLISNPEDYQDSLRRLIGWGNQEYKKCTPLKVRFYDCGEGAVGLSLEPHLTVSFRIIPVLREIQGTSRESRPGVCKFCGCTDSDCSGCIERTGEPCHWVDGDHTICSACAKS